MRLADILSGILAKAAKFGQHSGAGLFGEFEQRKTHLHSEVRTDKRGRTGKRWVKNADPVAAAAPRKGLDALGNMPALFGSDPAKKAPKPKAAKPAPADPLFDFDFGPAAQPAPIHPAAQAAEDAWSAHDGARSASADKHRLYGAAFNATSRAARDVPAGDAPAPGTTVYSQNRRGPALVVQADGTISGKVGKRTEAVYHPVPGEAGVYRMGTWGNGWDGDTSEDLYPYVRLGQDGVLRRMNRQLEGREMPPLGSYPISVREHNGRTLPGAPQPGAQRLYRGHVYTRTDQDTWTRPDALTPEDAQLKTLMDAWLGNYERSGSSMHNVGPAEQIAVLGAFKLSLQSGRPAYVSRTHPAHALSERPEGGARWTIDATDPTDENAPDFEEQNAIKAGALQVGSTRQENGVTYRLNDNHRWERVDDPEPQEAPAAAEDAPAHPTVTQAEYDRDPDRYAASMDSGQPMGTRHEEGQGTVLGPVHIEGRDRPLSVRTQSGRHAAIHRIDGQLTVDGMKGSRVTPNGDGTYSLQLEGSPDAVHLSDDGSGALTVTPAEHLPQPQAAPVPAIDAHDFVDALKMAAHGAMQNPDDVQSELELRAAVKNLKVADGRADGSTPHTIAAAGDTPAPEGQRYLVGLPENVTDGQRKRWNGQAEQLVEQLRATPRPTTEAERQLLSRYSGNGGIGASLNEYYTPPELGEAMWDALRALGSGSGRGLEPSSGPGVMAQFAGEDARMDLVELSPTSAGIANAVFGHRHDVHSMSYEAFRQRNPDAEYDFMVGNPPFGPRGPEMMLDDKYQDIYNLERYFTLASLDQLKEGGVAAMVIPHGIARNPTGADFRARIAARAQVVAIHALPTDTFGRAGTESATTDVWVLRGRPTALRGILDATGVEGLKAAGVHDPDFIAGRWHDVHPEQMHATPTTRQGFKGAPMYARDGTLADALPGIMATPNITPDEHPDPEALLEKLRDNPRAIAGYLKTQRGKEGDTRISDAGQMQICMGGRWHNINEQTHAAVLAGQNLSELIALHATTLNHGRHAEANQLRASLVRLLTEFRETYGNPHESGMLKRVALASPTMNNLLAAFSPDGGIAPSLLTDSVAREEIVDAHDPASVLGYLRRHGRDATLTNIEGLTSHAEHHETAAWLTGHGYAYHPDKGVWSAPGEFYSGDSTDVHHTIARALSQTQPEWAHTALRAQLQTLNGMIPHTPLGELEVSPRDAWVPLEPIFNYLAAESSSVTPDDLERWVNRDEKGMFDVHVPTYDKAKAKFMNQLKRYLTGKGQRSDEADVYEAWDEGFRDHLAQWPAQREEVEQAYADRGVWLDPTWQTDPVDARIPGWKGKAEGGADLHTFQNEAIHRSLAQGGGIMALDVGLGKTPTAIAQAFYARHIGATRKPIAAVPKSVVGQWRQKALRYKPDANIMVVGAEPQIGADGKTMLDDDGFEIWNEVSGAAALDRQLSQMKTGDFDLVIMTHTTLGRIQYDPVQQLALIQDEFYAQSADKYGKASGMSSKLYQEYAGLQAQAMINAGTLTLEQLQSAKKDLADLTLEIKEQFSGRTHLSPAEAKDKKKKQEERQRLVFMAAASRALSKDTGHPLETKWDELGVDHIIIDEAHNFKGLWTYSRGRGDKAVKYLGAPNEPSQRAIDLYYKTKAMRDANGGRGVYLLTATPIKNSPVELYNMLSYTAPQLFARLGIHNLDQFVARFCKIEEVPQVDEDTGEVSYIPTLTGLKNLGELRRECARFINRKTAVQVGLPLPHNDESTVHVEPRAEQSDLIKWVALNPAEAARKYLNADIPEGIKPGDEEYDKLTQRYALAMPHITRRAELDMEMIDPVAHKGYVSPKVESLLVEMERAAKAGQKAVIFSDVVNMPNPGGKGANPHGYSFHEKLKHLIHQRTGIPLEKIAIVNATTCPTGDDRLEVSNGIKTGKYQVVIGNTGTMGEGINLQHGVENLLHLDVPWNPAVWQQRVGRVVRQGNKSKSVNNRTFLGTRGLDKDMYLTLRAKGVWYDEFWNGDSDTMDNDGQQDYRMTPERLRALAIDDHDERAAALEAIAGHEEHNRVLAKRTAAVKLFRRYQSAVKAHVSAAYRVKDSSPEAERATVASLKDSAEKLRARLEKNPAFAPWVHHLERPEGVVLDAGSGRSFRREDRMTVTNASGVRDHVVVTGVDPVKGKVQFTPMVVGGIAQGFKYKRELPVKDFAQREFSPYDPAAHVRDAVHYGTVSFTDLAPSTTQAMRAALVQHAPAVREGLRARDDHQRALWKEKGLQGQPGGAGHRLIRRDGKLTHTLISDVQPEDEYVTGDVDRAELQAYLNEKEGYSHRYDLSNALREAHIPHVDQYGNGSVRIIAKATASLADLYTRARRA